VGVQHWLGLRTGWNRGIAARDRNYNGVAGTNLSRQLPNYRSNTQPTQKGKMKKLKSTVLCLFLLALSVAAFSGCRTAHGFGEDMENAGESIQSGTK